MVATLPINPYGTSNAFGSFLGASSTGYVSGTLLDHPTELFKIAGGVVSSVETLPMWGGVAIVENLAGPPETFISTAPLGALGSVLSRAATSPANITGWTVFNMGRSLVNYPGNPVPLAGSGNGINFVRKGSGVRLVVACDAALASLEGGSVVAGSTSISWDFNNQQLIPFAGGATVAVATTPTWSATTAWSFGGGVGILTLTGATSGFTTLGWTPTAGSLVNVSGATNAGTAGNTVVNGNFIVDKTAISGSNTVVSLQLPPPAASVGTITTVAGSIVLNFDTTAFTGVSLIQLNIGNSMVPHFNYNTGLYEWNRSGSTAVLAI